MEKQWWLVWSVILVYNIAKNEGCIEEERLGLLQFKQSAESVSVSSDILPSWVDNDMSDCCDWERVECNSGNTSHVTQLHLSNIFNFDIDDISYGIDPNVWYLNLSLFLPFKHLATLDLSWNKIVGFLDNQGFERLSGLKDLKALNLTSNFPFNSSVLPSLGALTSLETLILRNSQIMSVFPKEIGNLTNLETLDFSYNYFTGMVPLQELGKLTRLKVLLLHNNHLKGTLQTPAFALPPSLEQLSLSNNQFDGSLTSLCGLKRLEKMFVRNTYMGGSVPLCLNKLTSLKYLDLSFNSFTGPLLSSSLSSLTSLVYLDLTANLFNGSFSLHTFSNHSNLRFLFLSSPNTHFTLVNGPDWVPLFQLELLVVQNCGFDRIPEFLIHQNRLRMVDFSHNLMSGNFPNWLVENNAGLEQLILMNNSLTGPLSFSSSISSFNVSWFDVSDNFFTRVAGDFGTSMFPNLKFLNLSRNHFQGDFLFSPEGGCQLIGLDLSFNNFSGETPGKLVSSCVLLSTLKLSHNSFGGEIFTSGFNLTQLFTLELSDNRFIGTLPVLPIKFDWLLILDLRNNLLHGKIPSWIGNITSLGYLNLQDNFLQGTISCQLFRMGIVDLSYNRLSGSLPSCFVPQISDSVLIRDRLHINLQGNGLTGSIPEAFLNMSSLLTMDLRDNKLSGSIPEAVVAPPSLRVLLLGGNQITGSIPDWFCQLNKINLMDLSGNFFSGSIPQCFYNLSFGAEEQKDIFKVHYSMVPGGDSFYTGLPTGLKNSDNFFSIEIFFEEEIKFVTKHRSDAYKGDILNYMSGLDLSSNNLSGEIPSEMGNLFKIRALNLSRNQLTGLIPGSLSNLGQLESLDLSHNRLRGQIPSELISLNFLAVFSVAYNNLSGRIPGLKGQFSTFDKSSFEGNPLLCGIQLEKRCSGDPEDSPLLEPHETDEKWYDVDSVVFFASFSVSFLLFFIGVITVLYVNPYWRYKLLYHTEEFLFSCYYLLYDHLFRYLVRGNR